MEIYDCIGLVKWNDDAGKERAETFGPEQRILAVSASDAREQYREDNGADFKDARQKGYVDVAVRQFKTC